MGVAGTQGYRPLRGVHPGLTIRRPVRGSRADMLGLPTTADACVHAKPMQATEPFYRACRRQTRKKRRAAVAEVGVTRLLAAKLCLLPVEPAGGRALGPRGVPSAR